MIILKLVLDLSVLFYRVTVTFNVNNSVPPNMEEEPEQGQKSEDNEVEAAVTFMDGSKPKVYVFVIVKHDQIQLMAVKLNSDKT